MIVLSLANNIFVKNLSPITVARNKVSRSATTGRLLTLLEGTASGSETRTLAAHPYRIRYISFIFA